MERGDVTLEMKLRIKANLEDKSQRLVTEHFKVVISTIDNIATCVSMER